MNEKKFISKIKKEFPNLKWKRHAFIDCGWDHFVIILDKKMVFRTTKGISKNIEGLLYDEARLLKYLKQHRQLTGIPNYTHISKDKSIAGYNIMPGEPLEPTKFQRRSKSDKEVISKQLANFISALHATPKNVVKKYNVPRISPKKRYLSMVRYAEKLIYKRLSKKEVGEIKFFFEDYESIFENDIADVLVHADLKWEHLLWDQTSKKLSIIDFSDREFGDPALDFTDLWDFGDNFVERVYKLYKGKKDEKFLYRSRLYYKKVAILVMQGSLQGYPVSFKKAHTMFRERFQF